MCDRIRLSVFMVLALGLPGPAWADEPTDPEALERQANLELDRLNAAGDLEGLEKAARAYRFRPELRRNVRFQQFLEEIIPKIALRLAEKKSGELESSGREAPGTWTMLAERLLALVADHPRSRDADTALYNAAIYLERAGSPHRARRCLRRLLARRPDAKLADLAKAMQARLAEVDLPSAAPPAHGTEAERLQARLEQYERRVDRLIASLPAEAEPRRLGRLLQERLGAGMDLDHERDPLVASGDPRVAARALVACARLWEELGDWLFDHPVPAGLDPEQRDLYLDALSAKAEPMFERAAELRRAARERQ